MKKINRLIFLVAAGFLALLVMLNIYLSKKSFGSQGREYQVYLNRVEKDVRSFEQSRNKAPADLQELLEYKHIKEYPAITGLYVIDTENSTKEEVNSFLQDTEDYSIFVVGNHYYKITYVSGNHMQKENIIFINGITLVLFSVMLVILFYIRQMILLPFYHLSELPYELSKGNLSMPLYEEKNRFFGRFMWGMDLLRENLEENKEKQLELQKEKKMLLLSLSHDIKTPLSAIKLYGKALGRNLYQEDAKKEEILKKIDEKADEIEGYISEIVKASNDDFLQFEVHNGEFYVGEVLERIKEYYTDKMELNRIDFSIGKYSNCLVYGDKDRFEEVLQNIIENAIKYGDGKEIRIETEREEEELCVMITNTGCELENKELPHIFDSFFRGSNVEKKPGSGLGLYICRKLMQLMEGMITAGIKENKELTVQVIIRIA